MFVEIKTKMSRQHTVSRKAETQGTICAKEADLRGMSWERSVGVPKCRKLKTPVCGVKAGGALFTSSHGSLPVPGAVSVSQLPLPTLTSSSLLHLHAHLRSLRVSPDFPAPDGIMGSHALLSHHSLTFPVCLFSCCPSTCCLNSFKL